MQRTMREKREEPIRDRFVEYLGRTEGLKWETVAEDVPTKDGRKNCDYLLQCNTRTLALEITTRNDEQEALAHNSQSIEVWNHLIPLIRIDNLGGCTYFKTPSSYSMSSAKIRAILRNQGEKIARMIEQASCSIEVNQETLVTTALGPFFVKRVEGTPSLLPPMAWRGEKWKLAETYYQEGLDFLNSAVTTKDSQLDVNADLKVLGIVDNAPFGKPQFREAVLLFFSKISGAIGNIDRVFIEFHENSFERVYES